MAQTQGAPAARIGYRIDLRPPHDREIAKHRPAEDGVPYRNRESRWLTFIITSLAIVGGPAIFCWYWGSFLDVGALGFLIGTGIGGLLEAYIAPRRLLVSNPEWTGYVTQDAFNGEMIPYGSGWHPSHPWEQRNKSGNFSLRVATRDFSVGISTQTARVTVDGKYEYAIDISLLTRAIGVDESTVDTGLTAFITNFLTERGANHTAEEMRGMAGELNESLAAEFMQQLDSQGNETPDSFGRRYGFRTVAVVIGKIAFSDAVQKTMDAVDEADRLAEIASRIYGLNKAEFQRRVLNKELSMDDVNRMLNRAMATSDNVKAELNVQEFDIPAGIVNMFGSILGRAFGPQSSPNAQPSGTRNARRRRRSRNPSQRSTP